MGGGHTSARDPAPEEAGVGGTRLGGGFVPEAGDGLRQAALPVPRPRWEFGDFGVRPALAVPGDQVVLGGAASQTRVLFRFSLWGQGINSAVPGVRLKSLIGPREPGLTRPKGAACASPGPGGILLPWRPLGGVSLAPSLGLLARSVLGREPPLLWHISGSLTPPPHLSRRGWRQALGIPPCFSFWKILPCLSRCSCTITVGECISVPQHNPAPRRVRPPSPLSPASPGQAQSGPAVHFFLPHVGLLMPKPAPRPPPPPLGLWQASGETPGARVGRVCVCRVGDVAPRISLRVWPAVLRDDCRGQVRGAGAGVPPCQLSRR